MDTKPPEHDLSDRSQERPASLRPLAEPVAARALQSSILVIGLILLSAVLLDGQLGPALVGLAVVATALPPLRRYVDRWLVGSTSGGLANQAAIVRVAAGAAIAILAISGLFEI